MIKSIYDIQDEYREYLRKQNDLQLDLSLWLPSFKDTVRPVRPGELMIVMADTGHGKTAILQNIALSARPLTICLFELELPGLICFERFAAISNQIRQWEIERIYADNGFVRVGQIDHIYVCDNSKLKPDDIEQVVMTAKEPIDVVMLDYIGLMSGKGQSRYERMSIIAEDLKRVAKAINKPLIVSTQVHRKEETEIGLHDAKDSGSIENSAQLVLGAWRYGEEMKKMKIKVLKATSGGGGLEIDCDFDGPTLKITEAKLNCDWK